MKNRRNRAAFTLRSHGIGGILHDKLVIAFQHALRVFGGEHPAVFRCPIRQLITIGRIGATVVNAQLQYAVRVRLQTSQTYVKDVVSGIFTSS